MPILYSQASSCPIDRETSQKSSVSYTRRTIKRIRWILGVWGGVAHTYGTSPTGVRLLTMFLAIIIPRRSGVPTFLVYMGLGLILPESDAF